METLVSIRDKIIADIESEVGSRIGRNALIRILVTAISGVLYSFLRAVNLLRTDLFLDTTTSSDIVDRWGTLFDITRSVANQATGTVRVALREGFEDETIVIPAGTSVIATRTGFVYSVDVDTTVDRNRTLVNLRSDGTGRQFNITDLNAPLVLSQLIQGLEPPVILTGDGFTGGTDDESDASFRSRILKVRSTRITGGSVADYKQWASASVPNIVNLGVWVFPNYLSTYQVGVLLRDYTIILEDAVPPIDETQPFLVEGQANLNSVARNYINNQRPIGAGDLIMIVPTVSQVFVSFSVLEINEENATPLETIKLNIENALRNQVLNLEPGFEINRSSLQATALGVLGVTNAVIDNVSVGGVDLPPDEEAHVVLPTEFLTIPNDGGITFN